MPAYELHFADRLHVARLAGQHARLCGIALYRTPYWAAGYAYVHHPVPLYLAWREKEEEARRDLLRGTPAYNGVIAPGGDPTLAGAGYRASACRDDVCLWERAGGCDPKAATDLRLQTVLVRENS